MTRPSLLVTSVTIGTAQPHYHASLADFQPQDDVCVLFDPSGHPFCLFR